MFQCPCLRQRQHIKCHGVPIPPQTQPATEPTQWTRTKVMKEHYELMLKRNVFLSGPGLVQLLRYPKNVEVAAAAEVHRHMPPVPPPPVKKGTPWTEDEHRLFLRGLEKYGKGDWKSISRNSVISKTPSQVASHAQKYFKHLNASKKERKRKSIHDITLEDDQFNQNLLPPIHDNHNCVPPPDVAMQQLQELPQAEEMVHSYLLQELQQAHELYQPQQMLHSNPLPELQQPQQMLDSNQPNNIPIGFGPFVNENIQEANPLQEVQQTQQMLHSNPQNAISYGFEPFVNENMQEAVWSFDEEGFISW